MTSVAFFPDDRLRMPLSTATIDSGLRKISAGRLRPPSCRTMQTAIMQKANLALYKLVLDSLDPAHCDGSWSSGADLGKMVAGPPIVWLISDDYGF